MALLTMKTWCLSWQNFALGVASLQLNEECSAHYLAVFRLFARLAALGSWLRVLGGDVSFHEQLSVQSKSSRKLECLIKVFQLYEYLHVAVAHANNLTRLLTPGVTVHLTMAGKHVSPRSVITRILTQVAAIECSNTG